MTEIGLATINNCRNRYLNEEIFKQVIKEEYTKIFWEEVREYKKKYKMFSSAIDLFIKTDKTQNNLAEYVARREAQWWKYFDEENGNEDPDSQSLK